MTKQPTVELVGDIEHADFRYATDLLRRDALLVDEAGTSAELIVIANSHPDSIRLAQVQELRRRAPLAGVMALLGTWCEGESRTGRPWPGIPRLYWYEFPAWWRRQLSLRAAGRCPDWARPETSDGAGRRPVSIAHRTPTSLGLVVVRTAVRESGRALADMFGNAGYASVCHRIGWPDCDVCGAAAGIWEGGQLDEREAADLAAFCQKMARDAAPVIALLDFPRRERMQHALEIGAAAVFGKPWQNDALIETVYALSREAAVVRAA